MSQRRIGECPRCGCEVEVPSWEEFSVTGDPAVCPVCGPEPDDTQREGNDE